MVNLPGMTCIVCHDEVPNVGVPPYSHLQPHGGTLFTTRGHYGSGVFDPGWAGWADHNNKNELHIVICDGCLRAVASQVIWSEDVTPYQPPVHNYEIFDPEEHG